MSLVEGLFKKYNGFQLKISQWEILDQGVTALWGPSGAGKTSVMRILMGLEDCPTLKWKWGDLDLAKLKIGDRRIGIVFQNYELFPHLTAEQNIYFAAQARNLDSTEYEKKLLDWSSRLNLKNCLDRPAHLLSGGEKQRVALLRALMSSPRILFLDEPFSGLDEKLKEEARQLVKNVIEEVKIPALIVTHDERDLKILAHRVSRINEGEIVANE